MRSKRKQLNHSRYRVVLSDTLPYETPIIFSNRHFYKFLDRYKVELSGDESATTISWSRVYNDKPLALIMEILFGLEKVIGATHKLPKKDHMRVPFKYNITHKEAEYRELALMHPKNQLEIVEFYDKFKELIIYYSQQSPFSIRKPQDIAKYVYVKDSLHDKLLGDKDDSVEIGGKEYDTLKTFFTYERYSNIYKFYEDYYYHRAEKKFDLMFKFDISRCFTSIYTHSLAWALINKEMVKDKLNESKMTFGGRFDRVMQNANFGETNGILIGPEASRIFAELILQHIDVEVEKQLRGSDILHKKDYEIFRYVDDFFIFYNDESTRARIFELYGNMFKEYKLSVSEIKNKFYIKPLITELTIAKSRIVELLDERAGIIIDSTEKLKDYQGTLNTYVKNFCDANYLITRFKIIISEAEVEYKDIANYTLALINTRLEYSILAFEKHFKAVSKDEFKKTENPDTFSSFEKQKEEYTFIRYLIELLDFTSFIYTVAPRVNSTIKFSTILSTVIDYVKGNYRFDSLVISTDGKKIRKKGHFKRFSSINTHLVFKKIEDDITLVLGKHKMKEHVQLETLYLLVVLRELGRPYRLTVDQIAAFFSFEKIWKDGVDTQHFLPKYKLNYFAITSLLFYIENIAIYINIKKALEIHIIEKIKCVASSRRRRNSELTLLFLDLMVCPFLDAEFKKKMMHMFGVTKRDKPILLSFKNHQRYWFIKWKNFNLAEELHAKKPSEPYS